jgi:hypothetical protein
MSKTRAKPEQPEQPEQHPFTHARYDIVSTMDKSQYSGVDNACFIGQAWGGRVLSLPSNPPQFEASMLPQQFQNVEITTMRTVQARGLTRFPS